MNISWQIVNAQKELARQRSLAGIDAPLSTDAPKPKRQPVAPAIIETPADDTPREDAAKRAGLPLECRIQPTLALAFLDRFPAVGRHYFLLRDYDREQSGRGVIKLETAHSLLSDVCSRRRTQQILKQGNGRTWQVIDDRVFLFSPARVSIALDAGFLRGDDVIVDTTTMTGGIQKVRAAFFETVHTLRKLKDDALLPPTTRAMLERWTGVKPRSQYTYDKLTDEITVRANVHLGADWDDTQARQGAAIKHGWVFAVYDRKKKKRVIGRQLPNSYESNLAQKRWGRRKKSNRKIRDALVENDRPGNIKKKRVHVYHPNEQTAMSAFSRNYNHDHYWPHDRRLLPTIKRACRLQGVNTWDMVLGVSI